MYERFHRISQSMRMEEQTWQLLYYTCGITLKKCFELEFEKRQGYSDLELICAEFLAIDESRLSRKQLKKERKKQRKQVNNEIKQKTTDIKMNEASKDMADGDSESLRLNSGSEGNVSRSRSFSSVIDETEDSGRLLENFTFDDIEEIEVNVLDLVDAVRWQLSFRRKE